ncbi:MAG: Hemin import ATP-binding protein HmuV [Opitutia bacterium UBA7350]|nr:MAG: Hemin import ATP-binding protein HmuV [Opitutae bacterium UBA7350]
MIEAKGITFSAGSRKLIKAVTFKLQPGKFYGLLGPNGAGKSTLLRILNGEIQPDKGSVFFDERKLTDWSLTALAKIRSALPQRTELSFDYTVEEVVALGRSPFNDSQNESTQGPEAIQASLESFHLEKLRNRSYLNLSGGEQQRVQLARVFTQIWRPKGDPTSRFLLLDEPTAGLDLAHQQQLLERLQESARQGTTVIAALHDPNQVAAHADSLLVLAEGKLVADGKVEEILNNTLLKRYFGVETETLRTAKNGKAFSFRAPSPPPSQR